MRRRKDGTCMTQAQYQHWLVIERCMVAIHDHGTRDGANRASVMAGLKADGFTAREIAEAIRALQGDET